MKQLRSVAFLLVSIILVACGVPAMGLDRTPTPSEAHAKTGEIVTTANWAISVIGKPQADSSFIRATIKNISKVNQVLDLSRFEVTLLDDKDYIIATGITYPQKEIFSLPPGLKLALDTYFLSQGQYVMPKFSKIGISPEFAGVKMTFDSAAQQMSAMTSDETIIQIGQTAMLGNLQIELLNVSPDPQNDKPIVEFGVENNTSNDTGIQWIDCPGACKSGDSLIELAGLDNDGNILFGRNPGGDFMVSDFSNRIPARSKIKVKIELRRARGNYNKLLLYDYMGNAVVFKIK